MRFPIAIRILLPFLVLGILLSACSKPAGSPSMLRGNRDLSTVSLRVERSDGAQIEGNFGTKEFTMKLDGAGKPEAIDLAIDIASLAFDDRDNKDTERLLSDDFLASTTNGVATFRSVSIEKMDNGFYRIEGSLKMNAIVKTVSFDADITTDRFTGKIPFNRRDFEIGNDIEHPVYTDAMSFGMDIVFSE